MVSAMNTNWKHMFVWSSIGGVVLGAAVTLARKKRKGTNQAVVCRRIPAGWQCFSVWTERFNLEESGQRKLAHDLYYFEATPFKVWSVLDLAASAKRMQNGAPVYHVTQTRIIERWESERWMESERIMDRYYGTIILLAEGGKPFGRNMISRGGTLEIRKCLVGGSSNGIETGEKHRSEGRILNYRWDQAARSEAIQG
jgi:hypothetical protein